MQPTFAARHIFSALRDATLSVFAVHRFANAHKIAACD
ncbi:hypothetical protein Z949_2416 [Sulfitobacter guttiformis KCTC 32187]|nr:hypothetical protein Z949_2416 [Sulfitobacter guttiformis KCTC 32187]